MSGWSAYRATSTEWLLGVRDDFDGVDPAHGTVHRFENNGLTYVADDQVRLPLPDRADLIIDFAAVFSTSE